MISRNDRLSRRVSRFWAHTLVLLIVVTMFQAFPHPAAIDFFQPQPAMAETVSNPKFVSAAVMPNGQAGLLYANGDNGVNTAAEIRFFAYTTEHSARPSLQLSTAGPAYPPPTGTRHRTRGPPSGNFSATPASRHTPSRCGPSHCGQSSALTVPGASSNAGRMSKSSRFNIILHSQTSAVGSVAAGRVVPFFPQS